MSGAYKYPMLRALVMGLVEETGWVKDRVRLEVANEFEILHRASGFEVYTWSNRWVPRFAAGTFTGCAWHIYRYLEGKGIA